MLRFLRRHLLCGVFSNSAIPGRTGHVMMSSGHPQGWRIVPLQKSNGISFCIFFEFQILWFPLPGISTILNIVISAPKWVYLQCHLAVLFLRAKAKEMETWSCIWQHRAFKYFISLGLHNSQVGSVAQTLLFLFPAEQPEGKEANWLPQRCSTSPRAGIRMEVFWLLVQGSPNWTLEVKVALWVSVL